MVRVLAGCHGRLVPRLFVLALAGLLPACQALPLAPETPASDEPQELVDLREDIASCEAQLERALDSRGEFATVMSAQSASLTNMQGALDRMEAQLSQQGATATEAGPAQACEPAPATLPDKLVVGQRERVWIDSLQMTLPARIDTGAETASLDARNIEEFERNGKAWVRFDIVHPDTSEAIHMELEVVRFVRILQSSADAAERRAVIELGITIGDIRQEAEFTLSDRSHLDFQVLIGRNILRDLMIVDVGQSNIAPPRNKPAAKPGKSTDGS